MPTWLPFGVCSKKRIVVVARDAPRATELLVLADIPSLLREDLDPVVVAVGDDQPALRIELDGVRRAELARPCSGLADGPQKFAGPVEHRNAPDKIRVLDIG